MCRIKMLLLLSLIYMKIDIEIRAHCIKLTINGKLDFNGNYHRILDADWLYKLSIFNKFI